MNELEAFAGRRVLVTGHTGFKGSWLSLWLRGLGAEVAGFALAPEPTSHFVGGGLDTLVRHHIGDVRDAAGLAKVVRDFRPEVVFHLAAQPLVRLAYEEPRATVETNVLGTVNLLEAVRTVESVRACVMITSDKCYENREWSFGYRENDELGGHDPYSASKAAAEILISSYRRSFLAERGVGVASVRAGNVIGGGDWSRDRIVPDCITALVDDRPIKVRNPYATRPWQHVLEPLAGYLVVGGRLLADPVKYAQAFNFGPRDPAPLPVSAVVASIVRAWGSGRVEIASDVAAPHEANLLRLSIEKAAALLEWSPVLDAEEAIRWTVDWYKAWHQGARGDTLREIGRAQIARYTERRTKP